MVESFIYDPKQIARFLAASAPHSGDWLLSLLIASCGLRLSQQFSATSGDIRETVFPFKGLAVTIQRFNSLSCWNLLLILILTLLF